MGVLLGLSLAVALSACGGSTQTTTTTTSTSSSSTSSSSSSSSTSSSSTTTTSSSSRTTTTTTSSKTTSGTTSSRVSIPRDWTSYTYGSAAISVPSDWVVRHDTNCPDSQAAGTLLLGFPKVLENCPMIPTSISDVIVTTLPGDDTYRLPPFAPTPVMVNGIPVYQGFGSPSSLVWAVPTLGVQVTGTGPETRTILHTLRRA